MFLSDGYIAKEVTDLRTEAIAKEVARAGAALPSLSKQIHARQRTAWLSRQARRALGGLGGWLVAMGKRLERYGQRSTPQVDGGAAPV